MSHFVGLCFGDNWENQLEYYSENLEVEPYTDDGQLYTYNPNSKWDWYVIGGRWNGFLPLKTLNNAGDRITTNEACVGEVDWEYLLAEKFPPFCYIDEDGEWFEKGDMHWFCVVAQKQPEDVWNQQFTDYIKTLDPDCLVTVIDFHI